MTDHCQFDTYKRLATTCHPVDEVEGSKVCHDIMMNILLETLATKCHVGQN